MGGLTGRSYMKAFRETFARPVRRVRFLGLFDTVNAVPRFEQAWLKRSRGFPYTARSTARVVRHAVGIDERRAKFRQDLIGKVDVVEFARQRSWKLERKARKARKKLGLPVDETVPVTRSSSSTKSSTGSVKSSKSGNPPRLGAGEKNGDGNGESARYEAGGLSAAANGANLSVRSNRSPAESMVSFNMLPQNDSDSELNYDEDKKEQDIEEVWFPGCHGDIGGGWDLPEDEEPLSHGPLVWMVPTTPPPPTWRP